MSARLLCPTHMLKPRSLQEQAWADYFNTGPWPDGLAGSGDFILGAGKFEEIWARYGVRQSDFALAYDPGLCVLFSKSGR